MVNEGFADRFDQDWLIQVLCGNFGSDRGDVDIRGEEM